MIRGGSVEILALKRSVSGRHRVCISMYVQSLCGGNLVIFAIADDFFFKVKEFL